MIIDGIVVLYIFFVGAVFGSFLNVVLYRMRSGRSLMGRSSCGSCSAQLSPLDLIPVVSFLFLNGKCRKCESRISMQYPLVEMLTGTLFVMAFIGSESYFNFVAYSVLACLGVLIAVYDTRHSVIPALWNYAFGIVAFCIHIPNFLNGTEDIIKVILDGFVLYFVFWIAWKLSGGRVLGYGDVLLLFGIGMLLGVFPAFIAVWVACVVGSIYGLGLIAYTRVKKSRNATTLKSQIPFGPFLLFGTLVALVMSDAIARFFLSLTM